MRPNLRLSFVVLMHAALAALCLAPPAAAPSPVPDAVAHGIAWAVLAAATSILMRGPPDRVWVRAVVFGGLVECAQGFTAARVPDAADLVADAVGAAIGIGAVLAARGAARRLLRGAVAAAALALLGACAAFPTPGNLEPVAERDSYQPEYGDLDADDAPASNRPWCGRDPETDALLAALPPAAPARRGAPGLGIGDVLTVLVADDPVFSGPVEIDGDGRMRLPHLAPIRAAGRTERAVARSVAARLTADGHYLHRPPQVSVRRAEGAAARVFVAGAVFEPGTAVINLKGPEGDRGLREVPGDPAGGRVLSLALRGAGGVRPDADLSRVLLIRDGRVARFDMRPAVAGRAFPDPELLPGDEVRVPTTRCFDGALARSGPLTPPGIKVFMSNLTVPAAGNAIAAVGKDAREVKYGTRLSQAAVGMNCVGGTHATNASRFVVLLTRNPLTETSIAVERAVEELMRNARRDAIDPVLLPGDALACYDSKATNLRAVLGGLSEIAKPLALLGLGLAL